MDYDAYKLSIPPESGIHLGFLNGKLVEVQEKEKRKRITSTRCICCGKIIKGYGAPKCSDCKTK